MCDYNYKIKLSIPKLAQVHNYSKATLHIRIPDMVESHYYLTFLWTWSHDVLWSKMTCHL